MTEKEMERRIGSIKEEQKEAADFVEKVFAEYADEAEGQKVRELVPGALKGIRGVVEYDFYEALR